MGKQKRVELMDVAGKFNRGTEHHLVLVRGGGTRVTARVGRVEIVEHIEGSVIRFINVKQSTMTGMTGGKPSSADLPETFEVSVIDLEWANRPERLSRRFTGLKFRKKHPHPVQVANITGVHEMRIS